MQTEAPYSDWLATGAVIYQQTKKHIESLPEKMEIPRGNLMETGRLPPAQKREANCGQSAPESSRFPFHLIGSCVRYRRNSRANHQTASNDAFPASHTWLSFTISDHNDALPTSFWQLPRMTATPSPSPFFLPSFSFQLYSILFFLFLTGVVT